jgi:general secretion pathway protein L
MDVLLVQLPAVPDAAQSEAHWWHVVDGRIVARGADRGWLAIGGGPRRVIGLAPAALVRLSLSDAESGAATPRQAVTVARVAATERSLGDPATLHAVSSLGAGGAVITAVVANAAMLEWIDWARALGPDLDAIVPVGALLPVGDGWTAATIGSEALVARGGLVLPNEPALVEAIVGGGEVVTLAPEEVDPLLVAGAEAPPLDLRSGRFAKRRRLVIDRDRIRELLLLAAAIPLISLLWAIVSIVQLDRSTARLDAETLRIAAAAVGRPVTLETAESELMARRGNSVGPGLSPSVAALLQAMQGESGISSTQLGYRGDGTLSTTLAAPAVTDINRLLVALQRDGYGVTAVPRQAPDGRAMVDVTIRGGP